MAFLTPQAGDSRLLPGLWADRAAINLEVALPYQWERYEASGTIANFRIAAGLEEGRRRGFFYSDSDLHKWADASARALRRGTGHDALGDRLEEYVRLMAAAQEKDGYLFTYNQIHFPGTRWKNLMVEHELYCHGHFIEAGVSRAERMGQDDLLALALKAADLIVRGFLGDRPDREREVLRTSGHEEIEIALMRLYRLTRNADYLAAARELVERRGRSRFFGARLLAQVASQASRSRTIAKRGRAIAKRSSGDEASRGEGELGFEVGGNMGRREPPLIGLRSIPIFLSGAYQQQDRPIRERPGPRGHAVRWTYLMTAAAMLAVEDPVEAESLGRAMASAWEELVATKCYVTGGLGALPLIEGFGRPYELDERYSYSETCAAIGSIYWNRELSLAREPRLAGEPGFSGEGPESARYADFLEWQLYNAASVGVSRGGTEYFYRNPLSSEGEIARLPWYPTACCPSNLSRLWADIAELAYAVAPGAVRVDQYVSSRLTLEDGSSLELSSGLPWSGAVSIEFECASSLRLLLRIPGWSDQYRITLDGREAASGSRMIAAIFGPGRFDTRYATLELGPGRSRVELELGMPITAIAAHPRVRGSRGRAAIARGPLVYCAEAADNPGLDLDSAVVDPPGLASKPHPDFPEALSLEGEGLRLVPYYLWGNRGANAMRVFLRAAPR